MKHEASDEQNKRDSRSSGFVALSGAVVGGGAVGSAVFVGFTGLVLGIPIAKLWVPYTTLVFCGLVLAPLIYWARSARSQPDSCATRFGIAMFLYMQCLILALGFSAIRLGLVSQIKAVDDYAAPVFALSLIASILLSIGARQMLKDRSTN